MSAERTAGRVVVWTGQDGLNMKMYVDGDWEWGVQVTADEIDELPEIGSLVDAEVFKKTDRSVTRKRFRVERHYDYAGRWRAWGRESD